MFIFSSPGKYGKITGRVMDGETPLPYAQVILQGTHLGTVTNKDGYFTILDVPPGEYILIVRMIGYEPVSIFVEVYSDSTSIVNIGSLNKVEETEFPRVIVKPRKRLWVGELPPSPPSGIALSPLAEKMLNKNKFVIVPCETYDFFALYSSLRKEKIPVLLTSDIILHTSHLFFDYLLRILEYFKLSPLVDSLSKEMVEAFRREYNTARDSLFKEACRRNLAYFSVGASLLNPDFEIPQSVESIVNAEISLIKKHSDICKSPLFHYREDYTQFTPRGHYTRNPLLKRYFWTLMWYGRMRFSLEDMMQSLQSLLILKVMHNSPEIERKWKKIFDTFTLLIGETDDANYLTLLPVAQKVFGKDITLEEKDIWRKIDNFIKECRKLPSPKIFSTPETPQEAGVKNFRFFGQRFTFDSHILQKLVWPHIGMYKGHGKPFTYGYVYLWGAPYPTRVFPRGLDILSVLGSKEAEEILKEEGDTEYEGYDKNIEELRKEFERLEKKSIYEHYLFILKYLIQSDHGNAPEFMRMKAWRLKELNTALGFWSELRHDVILYVKMSATTCSCSSIWRKKKKREEPPAFVEPYPVVYRELRNLVEKTREYLEQTGFLLSELDDNFYKFEEFLSEIERLSLKELEGKSLSDEERKFIREGGKKLRSAIRFPWKYLKKVINTTDSKTPVIADVHTDYNSGLVLEEGVGNPDLIYVKMKIDGRDVILKGGVLSHYEFKQPISSRLTDEQWQEMIRTSPPPREKWVEKIVVLESGKSGEKKHREEH